MPLLEEVRRSVEPVTRPRTSARQLHELAHVAVRERAGAAAVPRWLDEGIARVVAGEHSTQDLTVLARARVADRLIPLAALAEGFPPQAETAALAYAQSGRAVSLLEERAPRSAAQVLALLGDGLSVDDALVAVSGRRAWQLDADVARSIPLWRAWAVVGAETDLALGLAGLLCAWAGLRARRRIGERMARLDDTEANAGASVARAATCSGGLTRWTVPRTDDACCAGFAHEI